MTGQASRRRHLETDVPAAAAAVVQDTVLGTAPHDGKVAEVAVIAEAAVTAAAVNFRTLRVRNRGQAGTGAAIAASLALDTPGTDDLVAYDEKVVPLSGVPADLVVAAGDVLVADETVAGAGLAHGGYRIRVAIDRS